MVRIGQHRPQVGGHTPLDRPAGIDVATLSELSINNEHQSPQLLDRHVLMLVTAGHGTHFVDFIAYSCRPGTLVWARPGQVVRFGHRAGLDAILVSWAADLLNTELTTAAPGGRKLFDDPFAPIHWQLAGEDEDAVINEISQLVVDIQRHGYANLAAELLRHQLAVLMLRVALLPSETAADAAETATFRRFCREVERCHPRSRRVDDYARSLGCSVRTLTRASLAATGRSAKQVIDDRVALAARRMLACTDLPIAEVGRRLGFSEPTNFGRFFHREVGQSPGSFRAGMVAEVGREDSPPTGIAARLPGPHRISGLVS